MNDFKEVVRLTYRAQDIADKLGISLQTWRRQTKLGATPEPLKFGQGLHWSVKDIEMWIELGMPSLQAWKAIKRNSL